MIERVENALKDLILIFKERGEVEIKDILSVADKHELEPELLLRFIRKDIIKYPDISL